MSKKTDRSSSPKDSENNWFATPGSAPWQKELLGIAARFDREYRRDNLTLPEEVQNLPIYAEWLTGVLNSKISSPFWEIAKPQKNQRCLDLGCGVSFLVYGWREWDAYFYGQDISNIARDALNSRGPQLNSKLFKGVELGPIHQLNYEEKFFDLVIVTGLTCYLPLDYWRLVFPEVKRVLKPDGHLVFDVLNPDSTLAEDWAILETYLGAEVLLESISNWEKLIKDLGGKIVKRQNGELFNLYKVKFP